MKAARTFAIFFLFLGSLPAAAQGTDIAVWASWAELESQDFEDDAFDIEGEFDSGVGFGVSANWFWWDRFSTELSLMAIDADFELTVDDGVLTQTFDLGSLDLTPIMLTGQFHFAPDATIDPYIGVGAAYVIADDLEGPDVLGLFDTPSIEIDDEFTFLVNAGLGIAITPNFGITLDARYIPLEPAAQAFEDEEETDLKLNPLIISAGLRWRF